MGRRSLILTGLMSIAAGSVFLSGCSGDDGSSSAGDAAPADAPSGDVSVTDTSLSVDAGAEDVSPEAARSMDALAEEATTYDVGIEATPDAEDAADVTLGEAAPPDAPSDVTPGDLGDAATCQPVDAGTPDPTAVSVGEQLVSTHFCQTCHGGDLRGGYNIAGAISKNLTPDPVTGLGCWTDAQIVTAMLYGTTPDGGSLCVMPQWATKGFGGAGAFDAVAAEQIVQYLRTLSPVSNVVPDTICPSAPKDAGPDVTDASTEDGAMDSGDSAIE